MRRVILILLCAMAVAETDKKPELVFTPAQITRLNAAQLRFAFAQKELEEAINQFNQLCAQAVEENKWPKNVHCDVRDLSAHQAEAPAAVK
jgi:hypothetical protein